jgi:hypothetical protein
MANQTGFQSNTTITNAFWIYKPEPATDPTGREVMVAVNSLQYIETTQDHTTVWLYYAASNVSSSQSPYILTGPSAVAFMASMEGLFS